MTGLEGISENLSGPPLLAALVALGLVVGVLTGLFGVGGAFLLNPILLVALRVPEQLIVGSSLCFTIGTGAAGVVRHRGSGNVDGRSTLVLAAGGAVGVLLGAGLLGLLSGLANFQTVFRALYVGMLLCVAYLVFREPKPHASGRSPLQRLRLRPRVSLTTAGLSDVSLPGLLSVGLLIGAASGLLGIGGGVLFMPLLLLVVGMKPHQAVGTSLGVVMLNSIVGTVRYGWEGHVSLPLAMVLLVGSSVGVQFGAFICDRIGGRKLRRYFALVVLAAAVMVAVDLAVGLLAGRDAS